MRTFMIAVTLCVMSLMVGSMVFAADVANGKALYDKKCQLCHGPQGKGDGPTSKMLKPPPADLTSPASKKKSDDELLQVIESGRPGTPMAGWKGTLSHEQMLDLLAYLRSLGR